MHALPQTRTPNLCTNLVSCCHLVETTEKSYPGSGSARSWGPGSFSVAGSHVVIKEQVFLLNSLAGKRHRLGSLPWGLCRVSHFGHPQHFSLLLSLDSQTLNIILSPRFCKITVCSFSALPLLFLPFFLLSLFVVCQREEERVGVLM